MSEERQPFAFDELPRRLPIFPLNGVLLLPGGRLPLHIFEPRYRAMTGDAMEGARIIGMIQPQEEEREGRPPAIYRTGCAGLIDEFSETKDGRYFVTLLGLCRFEVLEELPAATAYRQVLVSYARFRRDLDLTARPAIDRPRLLTALKAYLHLKEIPADWQAIEAAETGVLVNSLAMVCPFEANEKQALLEAADVPERARVMTALMEMALLGAAAGEEGRSAPLN
ncbi:MAG: LON peptidase substrate-binding domain-containing protein [Alphaproteobacteria bacterium]|nr:LON peptidase substrate-binding domain-containing protein [Alphaproteobacteria bacterium]